MDENRWSPTQLVTGLVGLAVALWGVVGSPAISDSAVLRWSVIGVAVLIGLVLIVVGGLSGRESNRSE